MLDVIPFYEGKAITLRPFKGNMTVQERCVDFPVKENKKVKDEFFNTDIHFDYFDIKVSNSPKIEYIDYLPFIERYKQRPIKSTRMIHFSNDFNKHELDPVWETDYFWKIFENFLSIEAPVIVEICNKLKEPLGFTQQHEKISKILREKNQVLGYCMNEDLHNWNNERRVWVSESELNRHQCENFIEWWRSDLSLQ